MGVLIPLYIVGRDDDSIDGCTDAIEIHIYIAHEFKCVRSLLYDEQVHVAVRSHITPCGRPKENDLFRLSHLYNAADNVVQNRLFEHLFNPISICKCGRSRWFRLLPQAHDEAVLFLNQVRLGAVVVAHSPNNPIAYTHAEMINIAVVSKDFF